MTQEKIYDHVTKREIFSHAVKCFLYFLKNIKSNDLQEMSWTNLQDGWEARAGYHIAL